MAQCLLFNYTCPTLGQGSVNEQCTLINDTLFKHNLYVNTYQMNCKQNETRLSAY